MKLFTYCLLIVLLGLAPANGQMNFSGSDDTKPADTKVEQKEEKEKDDDDEQKVADFAVAVKSAQIICYEGKNQLRVMLDQPNREINRISKDIVFLAQKAGKPIPISEKTLHDSYNEADFYHLMDLTKNTSLTLTVSTNDIDFNVIVFDIGGISNPNDAIYNRGFSLISRGLKYGGGKLAANPSMTSVSVSALCELPPSKLGTPTKEPEETKIDLKTIAETYFAEAKSKDSAEIKVSLAIDGNHKTKRYFQTTVKAEPFELKRLGMHGAYSLVPIFVELEKSGEPKKEVDKLIFGTKFNHYFVFNDDGRQISSRDPKPSRFAGFKSELTFRMETSTKFKQLNLITGIKTGVPINVFQTRSQSLRVTPFIGFDFGRILNTPASDRKQNTILRPFFGGELYFSPFRNEKRSPFVFEMSVIRRAFLKPELIYKRDANGKAIVEGYSTNPKTFANLKITLFETALISPFIQYTYGRDVPQYLKEDGHYRAGIQVNFDWSKK